MYERFTGRAEGAQCQSNLFCNRRESRGISGFDKENSIHLLLKYLNVDPKDAIAFGDWCG